MSGLWRAVALSVAGRYGAYAVGFLSLYVLARLFEPEHFGVIAAVQVLFTLGSVIAESGFGPAIINLRTFPARDRDGVFTVTIAVGLAIALAVLAIGPLLVAFFAEPRVALVVPAVALALVFSAATIVPLAHLQRDKRFLMIGLTEGVAEFVGAGVAVAAWWVLGLDPVIALASRIPVRAATRWGLVFASAASTEFGRPRLGSHIAGVRPLVRFASYQFGFNLVNFFARNLDTVLVGRFFGVASLGIYEKTYQIMRYPLMALTFAMTPAIQPALREHAHDRARLADIHLRFTRPLAYLGVAAGAAVIFLADWIVLFLLGPGWEDVVPLLRIFGVSIPIQVVLSTSGSFFQASGDTRTLFVTGVVSTLMTFVAMAIGVSSGRLDHLAWALTAAFSLNFLVAYAVLHRLVLYASPWPFARAMVAPGALTLLLALTVVSWLQ